MKFFGKNKSNSTVVVNNTKVLSEAEDITHGVLDNLYHFLECEYLEIQDCPKVDRSYAFVNSLKECIDQTNSLWETFKATAEECQLDHGDLATFKANIFAIGIDTH